MKITWYGHSCFVIENKNGRKIVLDPYDESLGGNPYIGEASIVTISHNHIDHNNTKLIAPGAKIINTASEYEDYDIKIKGFSSFHDKCKGAKRGSNIIFNIETDQIHLCHLGDLGHMLNDEEISLIGNMDVLFIPISKNFALSADTAYELCSKLSPKIIIPMHYGSKKVMFPTGGIESFITKFKNKTPISSNSLNIEYPLESQNDIIIFKL